MKWNRTFIRICSVVFISIVISRSCSRSLSLCRFMMCVHCDCFKLRFESTNLDVGKWQIKFSFEFICVRFLCLLCCCVYCVHCIMYDITVQMCWMGDNFRSHSHFYSLSLSLALHPRHCGCVMKQNSANCKRKTTKHNDIFVAYPTYTATACLYPSVDPFKMLKAGPTWWRPMERQQLTISYIA